VVLVAIGGGAGAYFYIRRRNKGQTLEKDAEAPTRQAETPRVPVRFFEQKFKLVTFRQKKPILPRRKRKAIRRSIFRAARFKSSLFLSPRRKERMLSAGIQLLSQQE
jgi:hypothetical protein